MKVMQISDVKTNLSRIINDIENQPISVTQNGLEQAVILGKLEYDEMVDTLYMLKILALGRKQIEEGETYPVDEAFKILDEKIAGKTKKEQINHETI